MSARAAVSVLIPTYNEEIHLAQCLRSVSEWADEVFVVDSFSTDRSRQIASEYGAHFVQHEFLYPAQQKNWAMENLPFRNEWLLMLDADEWVSYELRDEIRQAIATGDSEINGYWMRYRLMFYGRWIRHCGWYPTWILRLVRRSAARWEDRPVDEHPIVKGKVSRLKNDLIHESLRDMEFWIEKHNRYSSVNAVMYQQVSSEGQSGELHARLLGSQAERKRFIKEKIWPHLPARSLFYFFYLYVVRLGFLDRGQGFKFCYMHAIFQQFTALKLWELQKFKNGALPGAISVPGPLLAQESSERHTELRPER